MSEFVVQCLYGTLKTEPVQYRGRWLSRNEARIDTDFMSLHCNGDEMLDILQQISGLSQDVVITVENERPSSFPVALIKRFLGR